MKIFLTGSGGMVGRNILENPEAKNFEFLTPARCELDLSNSKDLDDYLEYNKPDFVIHAAGTVGGIQANIRSQLRFFLENFEIGKNVVVAASRAGIKRLINLGSSCMYPRGHDDSLTEDLILKGELEPTNEGYALAKISVQRLCAYIKQENSLKNYKTLVPCNLFGRWDKFSPEHSHLIPGVLKRLHDAKQSGAKEVEIWGDGTARREFMFAGDFAAGLIRAVTHFDSLPDVMNIGLGFDFSINEYYEAIAKVVGFQGHFVHDKTKPVGMARKLCDVQKQKNWGWASSISLETGLKQTYEFFKENSHE